MTLALLLAAPASAWSAPRWGVAIFPNGAEFNLEFAVDPEARARGYMGRERIGEREGMLFVFEAADHHGIWMKNCLTALDVIWLDRQLTVVDIARDLPPCKPEGPCPVRLPLRAARYVIEVAAGTTAREALEVGSRVVVLTETGRL